MPTEEDESVRHLVELGYVDPEEVSARAERSRAQRQTDFEQATKLAEQGRSQEAVALLTTLAEDNPEWPPPHRLLAELHYAAGRLREAQACLDWLTCHGVENPRLSLLSGRLALARRNLRPALDLLDYAQHAAPDLPGIDTLLGIVLLRLERLDAAEIALARALEKNASDFRALEAQVSLCLRRGEYEQAADWALQALEHNMQWPTAHYRLGVALAHMRRPEEAVCALETCARLDPQRAAPFYWLSRISADQLSDSARADTYRQRGRQVVRRRREARKYAFRV